MAKAVSLSSDQLSATSDTYKANTLEQLSARLRNHSTLVLTEDEYNGMVQPSHVREVAISDEDVRLMWRVLDYQTLARVQISEQQSQNAME